MREKLRSSKGMTLTELIVALAIVGLISISLSVGVSSAAKVYRDATRLSEAETLCGTILTYLEDEFRFSRNTRMEKDGETSELVFDSQVFGKDVRVKVDDKGRIKLVGKEKSIDNGFDLLSNTAYTSGLRVLIGENDFKIKKADNGLVEITITVGTDEGKAYASHTVTVAPVQD